MLAGIGYLVCATLICGRYIHNYALKLAGFLLLSAHVYLIDFFSLARGYGLMTCGVLWGIYFLLRYTERWEKKWLLGCILSFVLAVLANFTALLPFAAAGLVWGVCVLISKQYTLLYRHGLIWLISLLLLGALLFSPLKTLSASGEFEWGADGIRSMGVDLIQSLLYGVRYFKENTFLIVLFVMLGFMALALLLAFVSRQKEPRKVFFFFFLVLIANIAGIFFLEMITGAQPPTGRKSIYLIPIIFCVFVAGLGLLKDTGTASFAGIILSLALVGHMIRTLPIASVREWYYDAHYPELLSTIFPEDHPSDSVRMGTSWIFQPALKFYQTTLPLPLGGLEYQRPLVPDSTMHYYFVETSDTVGMNALGFDVKKNIGPFLLLGRD